MTDIFDELQWRGLVAQSTDEAALREALAEGPVTLYCGFDPSAPSLHFGNFVDAWRIGQFGTYLRMSLLAKSLALLGSGLLMLGLRLFVARRFPVAGEAS